MNIRLVQASVIVLLSSALMFPGLIETSAFSSLLASDRFVDTPTAENDTEGIVGIDSTEEVVLGQDEEKLVVISNNLVDQQDATVELESSLPWTITNPDSKTRTLASGGSTVYYVDTSQVDFSETQGTYTVKMMDEKLLIEKQLGITLVEPDVLNSDTSILFDGTKGLLENESETESNGISESVNAMGPPSSDLSGDGVNDVPYVNSSGSLKVSDVDGNTKTLVDGNPKPETDKTLMAVGRWKGSESSVFFAGSSGNAIYRASVQTNGAVKIADTQSNGAQAVAGIGDLDNDGASEIAYLGGSEQLRYVDDDGTLIKVNGGSVGSNNGIGGGQLPDLDNDGVPRVASVDGSSNIALYGVAESDVIISKGQPAKSPVTPTDIDRDSEDEILYIGTDNGNIKYIDSPLTSPSVKTVLDNNGNPISGDTGLGVISG